MKFDADFEREILIQSGHDPSYRRNVKRVLSKGTDPWSNDAHKSIWEVLRRLGDQDGLTPKIIAKAVKKEDDDDKAIALGKIGKRVLKGVSTSPDYALSELQGWVRHASIKQGLTNIVRDMKAGDIDEAEKELSKLARGTDRLVQDEAGDWFLGWEDRQHKRLQDKLYPALRQTTKTYFHRLDEILDGGLSVEQLGLIVAHTNVGKSMCAIGFAYNAALQEVPTVYVSTEMSKELGDTRLDSRFFDKPTADFISHNFNTRDLEYFEDKRRRMRARLEHNLLTVSTPINTLTKSMIEGYMDDVEESTGKPCGMIVIDSADHMVPEVFIREKRLQQMAVYWDLKELVSTRKVACWATTHAAGDHKALLTEFDTSESKDKSKIASVVLTLNQTKKERADDKLRMYVAKNRRGMKGTIIELNAHYAKSMFEEAPFDPDDDE